MTTFLRDLATDLASRWGSPYDTVLTAVTTYAGQLGYSVDADSQAPELEIGGSDAEYISHLYAHWHVDEEDA